MYLLEIFFLRFESIRYDHGKDSLKFFEGRLSSTGNLELKWKCLYIEMKMFIYLVMNVERGFPSKKYFIIIQSFKKIILPVKLLIAFAIFAAY